MYKLNLDEIDKKAIVTTKWNERTQVKFTYGKGQDLLMGKKRFDDVRDIKREMLWCGCW